VIEKWIESDDLVFDRKAEQGHRVVVTHHVIARVEEAQYGEFTDGQGVEQVVRIVEIDEAIHESASECDENQEGQRCGAEEQRSPSHLTLRPGGIAGQVREHEIEPAIGPQRGV